MSAFPTYRGLEQAATRYLFFTGKGGVGKTSLASATALHLADLGRRVLLVSTDPASNLDEVLGVTLSREPGAVTGSLEALNIDPEAAARAYRDRVLGPLRGVMPQQALAGMEESLSGSCTVEIAAFDEFAALVAGGGADAYDHVVFDTAPTGHTLRLMSLARAWDSFLTDNTTGASCLGPLAGLEKQRAVYAQTVEALSDASVTTVVLVSRPQTSSFREAERASTELKALGIANQQLIINGLFEPTTSGDELADAIATRQQTAIRGAAAFLASLPVSGVRLQSSNLNGLDRLRDLIQADPEPSTPARHSSLPLPELMPTAEFLDALAAKGSGVIMTMGKGGVGKTTVAAAVACALAHRGFRVHLTTTDPASHVAETIASDIPGLTVGRVDPIAETEAYRGEVLRDAGAHLDEAGRALLEEDLRSPCTEEIAVFRAFSREVAKGSDHFVVFDTAPTGHTLLLLDASQAHHRELERQSRTGGNEAIRSLLPRLRDPDFTRVLLVTVPEATPVHEAAALQEDLRRAGIEPFAWVINQSLAGCSSSDPLLRAREAAERPFINEVANTLAKRPVLLRWLSAEPSGEKNLAALIAGPEPLLALPK